MTHKTERHFRVTWEAGAPNSDSPRIWYWSDNGRPCNSCCGATCYTYSALSGEPGYGHESPEVIAECTGCRALSAFPMPAGTKWKDVHARDLSAQHRTVDAASIAYPSERAA